MVIIGMFDTADDTEAAIRDLKTVGFSRERIGVAIPERQAAFTVPAATASDDTGGGIGGGLLGGTVGLFGSLAIPGIGSVVVGGLLAAAVTRPGIGSAAGGLCSALTRMGVPEGEVAYFETGLGRGQVLIAVHAFTRSDEVLDILRQRHADFGPSGMARYTPGASPWGYQGIERRHHLDLTYHGTERRTTTIWI